MRVGFIGLGSQGAPMARRIIEAGFPTSLWARREETLEAFAGSEAVIAVSPAGLAEKSDVICVCVVDDAGVEQVLTSEEGVLSGCRQGSLIVIHSTVHPSTCNRLAHAASAAGATLIDAPVSGGGQAASEQRLLVMVGGGDEEFERVLPVLATFGNPVLHLGPLGAGQMAKALNNLLFTAHLATASALFELARSLKIDREALAQAITHGSARSYAFEVVAGRGFTLESFAGHVGGLLSKDVGIVSRLAEQAAASPEILLAAAKSALREMRS
jgi:3-hydroxyisobutyrate dehydrogenase-like beta-hydroxyacid dehydrogenase